MLERIQKDCQGNPELSELKSQLNEISNKVVSVQPLDRQTAWGFPTVSLANADESTKREKWNMAGSPLENLQTGTGKPLIHTRWIENEQLVAKKNHMQNSIKRFNHEAKMKAGQTFGTEEYTEKNKASSGSNRVFVPFTPNAQRLSSNLKVVHDKGLTQGRRALPDRPEEQAIMATKKGLMRECHGEREDAIHGQESRQDQILGNKKLYGDEIMQTGPTAFLRNL